MSASLARNWWAIGSRNLATVAFGLAVVALLSSSIAASLAMLFAAYLAADGMIVALVSWPGLARPSTISSASAPPVVDGRHKHALGRAGGPARGAGRDTD